MTIWIYKLKLIFKIPGILVPVCDLRETTRFQNKTGSQKAQTCLQAGNHNGLKVIEKMSVRINED